MRPHEIPAGQVRGRPVLDKAGDTLGNVEDFTVDTDSLRVTSFIVKVSREAAQRLRLGNPILGNARIEVGVDRLGSLGDSILLNVEQREIAGMLLDASR